MPRRADHQACLHFCPVRGRGRTVPLAGRETALERALLKVVGKTKPELERVDFSAKLAAVGLKDLFPAEVGSPCQLHSFTGDCRLHPAGVAFDQCGV